MTEFTIDELISVCIARQVVDGGLLAQGISTPLVMAGFILAKCTHAPNVKFTSAIGQSLVQDWSPLGVGRVEDMWLAKAQMHFGFVAGSADLLPAYRMKEIFRSSPVAMSVNFHN